MGVFACGAEVHGDGCDEEVCDAGLVVGSAEYLLRQGSALRTTECAYLKNYCRSGRAAVFSTSTPADGLARKCELYLSQIQMGLPVSLHSIQNLAQKFEVFSGSDHGFF